MAPKGGKKGGKKKGGKKKEKGEEEQEGEQKEAISELDKHFYLNQIQVSLKGRGSVVVVVGVCGGRRGSVGVVVDLWWWS